MPGSEPSGCSIDAHGTVLVASDYLIARDPDDGAELWRLSPAPHDDGGVECILPVTIGPDRIYFAECGGPLRVATAP
jgi:hypothetical protein